MSTTMDNKQSSKDNKGSPKEIKPSLVESESNDQSTEASSSNMECPNCKTPLQKFLIQQNYSIVMCPKEDCEYPFDQEENFDNILYIDDKEISTVARHEFSVDSKEE